MSTVPITWPLPKVQYERIRETDRPHLRAWPAHQKRPHSGVQERELGDGGRNRWGPTGEFYNVNMGDK